MKFSLRSHAARVRRHARGALGCALAATIAVGALVLVAPTTSGFSATVKNPGNSFATGTAFLTVKDSGGTTLCTSVPAGSSVPATDTFPCSGQPLTAQVGSSVTNTTISATQSGTQAFGGGKLGLSACYPRAFANSLSSANPQVLHYGVVGGQAGPTQLSGSASATFDGSTGSTIANVSGGNPQTFSVVAWFKTTAKQGAIMGFQNTAAPSGAGGYDRILFINTNGDLVWDTVPGGGGGNINEVTTSGTNYADGAWHMVVGIGAAGNPSSSISMYVDNQLIGTRTINQTISAESYSGWWHIGYTSLDARPNAGSPYFAGSIANAATFPSALTAEQVASLWGAGSQSGYVSAASGAGANAIWPLGAESTHTGQFLGSNDGPCAHTTFYLSDTAVGALSADPTYTTGGLGVGVTWTGQLGLATNSNYTAYDGGVHLDYTAAINQYAFSQAFTWPHLVSVLR